MCTIVVRETTHSLTQQHCTEAVSMNNCNVPYFESVKLKSRSQDMTPSGQIILKLSSFTISIWGTYYR